MELAQFLVKAKLNTYAKDSTDNEIKLPDSSREFTYEDGIWRYRDRYYGFDPFSGQEVVWKESIPYWTMNYYGKTYQFGKATPRTIYKVLKKALLLVTSEKPFRGPHNFRIDEYEYGCILKNGDIGLFDGFETIAYWGKEVQKERPGQMVVEVFRLNFQGGLIS